MKRNVKKSAMMEKEPMEPGYEEIPSGGKFERIRAMIRRTSWMQIVIAAILIFLPIVGAAFPGILVATSSYREKKLNQPSWAPPSWLFGPVWSVLYLLMGTASFLVWHYGRNPVTKETVFALVVYGVQLVLNWFWTPIFFAWGLFAGALVEISIMWTLILFCIILFFGICRVSSLLLLPYFVWVTFATCLNYSMLCLNSCSVYMGNNTGL